MIKAIVGANWGDEGKGKITDMLSQEADIIIRFQGGSNAGHTIKNNYGKFALHMLPSGVFYDHTTSILGNGVALNIPYMFNEIKSLTDQGVPEPKILVSDRAQILYLARWHLRPLVFPLIRYLSYLHRIQTLRHLIQVLMLPDRPMYQVWPARNVLLN